MIFTWNDKENNNTTDKSERVDYAGFSDDQLMEQFKTENWSKLDESGRIDVIQEMENRNAVQQNREPAEVVSVSRVTSYGSYNNMNNQIKINVSSFSSYETLDTYAHESNHAYQVHCIEKGIGFDEYTRNMMEVETKRDENGKLYNYARTSPQYDMQCNELDSNNRAAGFLLSNSVRYKDDQGYKDYIAERNSHFKDVNYALDNNPEIRTSMQKDQIYTSYVRGDISQKQYDSLNKAVDNPKSIDPTVIESHSLGETLSELNTELNQGNVIGADEAAIDQSSENENSSGVAEDNSVSY